MDTNDENKICSCALFLICNKATQYTWILVKKGIDPRPRLQDAEIHIEVVF
jgi:hypothetical protein